MANVKNVLGLGLLVGMTLCAATAARAQSPQPATEKFFVNVNFGGQLAERTLSASANRIIYEETATFDSTQTVDRGPVFDVAGGYRVWHDIFVGIGFSRFADTASASTSARIPDPIFFNRPRTVNGTAEDLKRTETGIYPHIVWTMPVLSDRLDVAAAIGAAVIKVKQDLVTDFSVPAGTQVVNTARVTEEGTASGVYAAVDLIYNIVPRVGAGFYVRYAGGKVDLPSVGETNVGGMHVGGGIRLRF